MIASASTNRPSRLAGIDIARGVALLGMIAAHALLMTTDDGVTNPVYYIVGGRAAALFAVLAGVAIAFMTGRAPVRDRPDRRAAAATLLTRAGLLLLIGFALGGWTDSDIASVILAYYAVMFALAVPLVRLSARALTGTAAAVVVAMPVLSHLLRSVLPEGISGNPSFADAVQHPAGLLEQLTLTGTYPALPWMAYLSVGIAVGRLRLDAVRTATRLLAGGVALAVVATGASLLLLLPGGGMDAIGRVTPPENLSDYASLWDYVYTDPSGTSPTTTWWWLTAVSPHSGTPFDLLVTIGSALAVIGAAVLLGRTVLRSVLSPLAAAGSMTLTIYTASILFMNSPLDDFDPWPGYLVQVVVALVLGHVWRRFVGRGPLESVVTAVTHRARDAARGPAADRFTIHPMTRS
ncbi:heparan-alpha-glucosaminide N-acetyltransferase domain-containing protein [Pseudonocardia endophytica]|uniref:Putative membrane protein YeiB n=1 Tax=Pseudonocardia endophytica TaxID=401976 RepID=A0A4R1HTJ8_PSEEN|nr:heparan-alpha-glucosaminide N-acetyltransferase domain-containing protein [Pseudonocardia endophytica]TCK24653.1 putative membrane protein YeiB [Pseudonocardia endophytica]